MFSTDISASKFSLEFPPDNSDPSRYQKRRPKRALLIEDSTEAAFELAEILRVEGFRVQSTSQLFEAHHLLSSECIDIILCEVDLELGDSLGFIAELRKDPQHESTPVVAISRIGSTAEITCLAVGADMYCPEKEAKALLPSQIAFLMEYAKAG